MHTIRRSESKIPRTRWAALVALAACLVSTPAHAMSDPEPARPHQTTRWPAGDRTPLSDLHTAAPACLPVYLIDPSRIPSEMPYADAAKSLVVSHEIIANKLTDTGLLRVYHDLIDGDELPPDHKLKGYGMGFKPNASFIPAIWWPLHGEAAKASAGRTSARRWTGAHLLPGVRITADEHTALLDQGVRMHIPTTITGDEIGIVVHLWSLGPNEFEQRLIDRFAKHGWLVVDVDADIRNDPPNWAKIAAARERQTARAIELFEQTAPADPAHEDSVTRRARARTARDQARAEHPAPESAFAIHPGDDLDAKGALIARAIDNTLAQHAYAVEAIVAYLDTTHPRLAAKPIVLAGLSAGAIATPTVTARLQRRFAGRPLAMLMVGGAADLFTTAIDSSLTDAGLDLTPIGSEPPDDATIDQLAAAYRAHTQLDPLTLAPTLSEIPTYILIGSRDTMVPYAQGTLLAQSLPHARVDTLPVGHEALFLTLPIKQAGIVRYIERALDAD